MAYRRRAQNRAVSLFGDSTTLEGQVHKIWFRGEDAYAIGQFRLAGTGESVVVRGAIGDLPEGQPVELAGRFERHPRYGRQFRVESVTIRRPESKHAVEAYLASDLVQGVGPALAARIVDKLGADALEIIESDPQRLLRVPGIGPKKAAKIRHAVTAQSALREVMLFLHGHGLSAGLAHKILRAYGEEAPRLLQNDPYRLAEDVVGVGFRRADAVAARLGVPRSSAERKRAGILFALSECVAREGHCCPSQSMLLDRAAALLELPRAGLEPALEALVETRRLVREQLPAYPRPPADQEARVYPITLHASETGLAAALWRLLRARPRPLVLKPNLTIARHERDASFTMTPTQREAVKLALREPVCVITGGPGVGKTTTIRALAAIAESVKTRVALAAPTGRAAKRLSEATGRPASTLHRLLEFQPGKGRFARSGNHPLEADLLVVDESSMLDLPLAYQLVRAVRPGARLVFVGDVDQLPSVGPGRVLDDLIRSECAAVVRLDQIFRQQAGSAIVRNAHRILQGDMPLVAPAPGSDLSDFYLIEQDNAERALDIVLQLVGKRIPQAFNLDPVRDVQVLSPMYRGPLGVDSINERLGEMLVPAGPQLTRGTRRFRQGDKVLQLRNDYDLELFNGDPGRVLRLDPGRQSLVVQFADREVELAGEAVDQIVPAYGITVHRAQGSEYPAVVLTLDRSHSLLLNRRLLYTAVTRAKRLLVLVGSRIALERAVRNHREDQRLTGLKERLRCMDRSLAAENRQGGPGSRDET